MAQIHIFESGRRKRTHFAAGVIDEPTALDDWCLPLFKRERGIGIFGNNIFHGTVDSVRGKVCSTRCRGNRPISLQLNVYFCAPSRRHKATRNILISVFLVACDTDRSHQKAQAEKTNRNTYALPPLLSCCSLLSHKCGWVFGLSMHVVRIRLTGAMVIEILHHLTHNTVQPERCRYISPRAAIYSHR